MKMFEKGKIGKIELRNRIIMDPMGTTADPDGGYSTRCIRYFEERAKGGVGMVITGANTATEKFEPRPCNLLDNFFKVGRLHELADRVHHHGAKLCVQVTPGLGRMVFTDPFTPPYSASAVNAFWFPNLICKPFSKEEIATLVQAVGFTASLAKAAGADAVELHAYGGYLIDQFQSAIWNKREDEYGGDLKGRMRFTMELIAEIQKTCGKDFPLLVKYTPVHGIPGGRELDEGIEMAKMYEAAGVAALHIDMGCYECWYDAITTVYQGEATQIHLADAVRKVVAIPIISQGKLNNPVTAEKVLQEGKTDFVGMGHQMLCDPQWVNKVKAGATYDIVPCIGCNECLYAGFAGKNYLCAVNPACYHEDDYPLIPATEKKKVLVIGGGPGGMMAAITAAERGFDVELWEKSNKLGGTLLAAGAPVFKKDVMDFVAYISNKLHRSKVTVRMMKEATKESVARGKFEKVILATGSTPVIPPIPGADGCHVKTSTAVLTGAASVGKNIVVIGGGLVGCETALHLHATADKVTIVEMLDDILVTADHCLNNDLKLRALLAASGMDVHAKSRVTAIGVDFVEFTKDGATQRVACDTVVMAAGYKSTNALAIELETVVEDLSVVGDAVRPAKIVDAVHEAYHAIRLM